MHVRVECEHINRQVIGEYNGNQPIVWFEELLKKSGVVGYEIYDHNFGHYQIEIPEKPNLQTRTTQNLLYELSPDTDLRGDAPFTYYLVPVDAAFSEYRPIGTYTD